MLKASQDEGSALKDLLGVVDIRDSPSFPSFIESMLHDAQAVETCHWEGVHGAEDLFRGYFVGVEEVIDMGDLDVLRKSSSKASSSFNLTNQFSAPNVDPGLKLSIIISVPEDTRVLSALVGVSSYL